MVFLCGHLRFLRTFRPGSTRWCDASSTDCNRCRMYFSVSCGDCGSEDIRCASTRSLEFYGFVWLFNIAMENHHFKQVNPGKPSINGPFSRNFWNLQPCEPHRTPMLQQASGIVSTTALADAAAQSCQVLVLSGAQFPGNLTGNQGFTPISRGSCNVPSTSLNHSRQIGLCWVWFLCFGVINLVYVGMLLQIRTIKLIWPILVTLPLSPKKHANTCLFTEAGCAKIYPHILAKPFGKWYASINKD